MKTAIFLLLIASNAFAGGGCIEAYSAKIENLNKWVLGTAIGGGNATIAAWMHSNAAAGVVGGTTMGILIALDIKRNRLMEGKDILEGAYGYLDYKAGRKPTVTDDERKERSDAFKEAYKKFNKSLPKKTAKVSPEDYASMLVKADQAKEFCPVTGMDNDKRKPMPPKKMRKLLQAKLIKVKPASFANVDDARDRAEDEAETTIAMVEQKSGPISDAIVKTAIEQQKMETKDAAPGTSTVTK